MKTKKSKRFETRVGHYEPVVVEKGVNETTLSDRKRNPLKEGDLFWMVNLGDSGNYDCETQTEAEIISRLVRIENLLKRLIKR